MEKLEKDWIYNVHTYKSASYGDCVSAHQISVKIFNALDEGKVNAGKYENPGTILECSYGINIDSSKNDELAPTIFLLPLDIVISCDLPTYSATNLVQTIVTVAHPDNDYGDEVVLYLDFSASEPITGDL